VRGDTLQRAVHAAVGDRAVATRLTSRLFSRPWANIPHLVSVQGPGTTHWAEVYEEVWKEAFAKHDARTAEESYAHTYAVGDKSVREVRWYGSKAETLATVFSEVRALDATVATSKTPGSGLIIVDTSGLEGVDMLVHVRKAMAFQGHILLHGSIRLLAWLLPEALDPKGVGCPKYAFLPVGSDPGDPGDTWFYWRYPYGALYTHVEHLEC
jgi:hypothetical protein